MDNMEDVIDSRDVIARIEELEARMACENCGQQVTTVGRVENDSQRTVHFETDAEMCGYDEYSVATRADPLDLGCIDANDEADEKTHHGDDEVPDDGSQPADDK